jgi:hypothetical protein
LSLVTTYGFPNINLETTASSLLTGMACRLKIGAVASGDMVVVEIGTAEDDYEIANMVRLKVG